MKSAKGGTKTTDPVFVVIAEDDSSLGELIACVVEQAGATPLPAYDGEQALRLAHAYAPAVVITDLMMPRMSGDALIAALREKQGANPSIILISAAPPARLLRAGADAILPKPFDLVDLHELLDRYLTADLSRRPTKANAASTEEPCRQTGSPVAQLERYHIPVGETVLLEDALDAG
jgi:DNA-binding response OmpR family regulator